MENQQSDTRKKESTGQDAQMTGTSQVAGAANFGNFPQHMQQPPHGTATASSSSQSSQQIIPPHILGMMTNPALAAAAAASPLFPPAAMLSNPAAFMAMPGAYGMLPASHPQQQSTQQQTGQISSPNIMQAFYGTPNQQAMMNFAGNSAPGTNMSMVGGWPPLPPGMDDSKPAASMSTVGSVEEKAQQNRDRNREHARSTRLRKKAYVQKLKELVEGLHAERTEELRQRRVAIQHLAETQNVRKAVVRSFLDFIVSFDRDERRWNTILEDEFWLKQPVTPYRSFRRSEITQDGRISKGTSAVIADSASNAVMIECIGYRSQRWMKIKRDEFLALEEAHRGSRKRPPCVVRQESKFQHAMSSLSSGSASNQASSSSGEDSSKKRKNEAIAKKLDGPSFPEVSSSMAANKVSSESGSGNDSAHGAEQLGLHNYHAKPLPDPKILDPESSATNSGDDSSPTEDNNDTSSNSERKQVSTESSGEDSGGVSESEAKRRKIVASAVSAGLASYNARIASSILPGSNIAAKGGIAHNVNPRLNTAPAVPLPPFSGLGKNRGSRSSAQSQCSSSSRATENAVRAYTRPSLITADHETASSDSGSKMPTIGAAYHVNEDDIILMDDVLMCPFVFRSIDAISCGALSECVMPGMLRAHFSARNKLKSVELVYDAMGLMQQLERASGNDGVAQIIPTSIEMALGPTTSEARVITMANAPFKIVNVNEAWTKITGYSQMEAEGRGYHDLLDGEGTIAEARHRPKKPSHVLEEVAMGLPACSTNIHYDKDGRDFIEFVASYPLTNSQDSITHLLHISRELPSYHESTLLQNQGTFQVQNAPHRKENT